MTLVYFISNIMGVFYSFLFIIIILFAKNIDSRILHLHYTTKYHVECKNIIKATVSINNEITQDYKHDGLYKHFLELDIADLLAAANSNVLRNISISVLCGNGKKKQQTFYDLHKNHFVMPTIELSNEIKELRRKIHGQDIKNKKLIRVPLDNYKDNVDNDPIYKTTASKFHIVFDFDEMNPTDDESEMLNNKLKLNVHYVRHMEEYKSTNTLNAKETKDFRKILHNNGIHNLVIVPLDLHFDDAYKMLPASWDNNSITDVQPIYSNERTPLFTNRQGYLQDLRILDSYGYGSVGHYIDYGLYTSHEDLKCNSNMKVLNSRNCAQESCDHGTASYGILMSCDNNYGTTGMSNRGKISFDDVNFDVYTQVSNVNPSEGSSICSQFQVQGNDLVPYTCFAAYANLYVKKAQSGQIVSFSAGNGYLDISKYSFCNDGENILRAYVNNYPIFTVGASHPNRNTREDYSNYNSVTSFVHAWGDSVTTTGYGDLQNQGGTNDRSYTSGFAGTSSATPITFGAFQNFQGYMAQKYNKIYGPLQLLNVLRNTKDSSTFNQEIGYKPRVKDMIAYVEKNEIVSIGKDKCSLNV